MHSAIGFVIVCALNYGTIYLVFRYGFLLSGLLAWVFPAVAFLAGLLWIASMTHFWLVVPTAVVTFFAARQGMRSRGA